MITMRKNILLIILLVFTQQLSAQFTISSNHRYLLKNNKPFFWLGDTGWELFHRLNKEDIHVLVCAVAKGLQIWRASEYNFHCFRECFLDFRQKLSALNVWKANINQRCVETVVLNLVRSVFAIFDHCNCLAFFRERGSLPCNPAAK